eukprot:3405566-Amphidinium_carterae.1
MSAQVSPCQERGIPTLFCGLKQLSLAQTLMTSPAALCGFDCDPWLLVLNLLVERRRNTGTTRNVVRNISLLWIQFADGSLSTQHLEAAKLKEEVAELQKELAELAASSAALSEMRSTEHAQYIKAMLHQLSFSN